MFFYGLLYLYVVQKKIFAPNLVVKLNTFSNCPRYVVGQATNNISQPAPDERPVKLNIYIHRPLLRSLVISFLSGYRQGAPLELKDMPIGCFFHSRLQTSNSRLPLNLFPHQRIRLRNFARLYFSCESFFKRIIAIKRYTEIIPVVIL
jgi:hypothetical protein